MKYSSISVCACVCVCVCITMSYLLQQGLLKGGSKRRATPIIEISKPLPSNAVWKKVHLLTGSGKKEKEYTQGWTLTDEPLCKLCQDPCT